MKYIEKVTLACRGAVHPAPPEEVSGTLLIGEQPVLQFYDHFSQYGEDHCYLFPVFHNGIRCWLRSDDWMAAKGYSASGTNECIISFDDGVKILIEHGVFAFQEMETR